MVRTGLIVELCSSIISWPCSSSMVMAVSSTLSRSGSELEDQLWLDESTNSKKEDRPPRGAPRAVLQSCSVLRTGTAANPSLTHGEAVAATLKLGLGVG